MPPKTPVIIRTASVDDLDAILAVTFEVFAPTSISAMIVDKIGPAAGDWRQAKGRDIRNELEANGEGCFVAECDGRIVGYALTNVNELSHGGTVKNLAVAASFQRQGIGRKLLTHSIDYFRSLGLSHARIETLSNNAASQHLYPAEGFTELIRQIHYYMPL